MLTFGSFEVTRRVLNGPIRAHPASPRASRRIPSRLRTRRRPLLYLQKGLHNTHPIININQPLPPLLLPILTSPLPPRHPSPFPHTHHLPKSRPSNRPPRTRPSLIPPPHPLHVSRQDGRHRAGPPRGAGQLGGTGEERGVFGIEGGREEVFGEVVEELEGCEWGGEEGVEGCGRG